MEKHEDEILEMVKEKLATFERVKGKLQDSMAENEKMIAKWSEVYKDLQQKKEKSE